MLDHNKICLTVKEDYYYIISILYHHTIPYKNIFVNSMIL